MVELNTGLPSTRWLHKAIHDKLSIEIKLSTAEVVTGQLRWLDPDCICLADTNQQETLIWKQAIATVRLAGA